MGNFFGSIYCWLEEFFGLELANYLWGMYSPSEVNLFIGIGFTMILISLFSVVLYYYIIDHPRLCNWWGWSIFLIINAVINFIVGWQYVLTDFYNGLMVEIDPVTNKMVSLNIDQSNILAFGVTNMINSIIAFFVFTCIVKWWSTNCSGAPFK